MKALLDSSAIIELLRGNVKVMEIIETADVVTTSVLCAYEVLTGEMYRERREGRSILQEVTELIAELNPLPLQLDDSIKASEICSTLMMEGRTVNTTDILISAQAIRRDLTVITKDKDFKTIKQSKSELKLHLINVN